MLNAQRIYYEDSQGLKKEVLLLVELEVRRSNKPKRIIPEEIVKAVVGP